MFDSQRVASFSPSIFAEFSRLAAAQGAVNLGQGFPDFDGPAEIKQAAIDALNAGVNQYAMTTGAPVLRAAISAHAQRFYGQTIDPDTEVVVTSGATEAIFDAAMGLINPGDEVVLFEPYYDSYLASVQMAGGVPKFVQLRAPDATHTTWWFDEAELASAFSTKTAVCFLNTPHNPTGKVFTREELLTIGGHCSRVGAVLLSDEVYEHLVFAPAVHVRPATLPGFDAFTLTISSGGKSFSFTGWKVGWAIGRRELIAAVQKAHQWVTFAVVAPLQHAIAKALLLPDEYFTTFQADYRAKRDSLAAALTTAGLEPMIPEGAYFIIAKTDALRRSTEDDVAFCRRLLSEVGVAAIPPSVFYSPEHAPQAHSFARFAFCKTQPVLDEGVRRLKAAKR